MDADTGEEQAEPAAGQEDLLAVIDTSDKDTGVVHGGDEDHDVDQVGRDMEPKAGDRSNKEVGGGSW